MAVFVITTTIPTREGFVWFPFDVPGIDSVDELTERLVRDGIVSGTKYERIGGRRDEGGLRYRKERYGLGRGMVGTIKISPESAYQELEARSAA